MARAFTQAARWAAFAALFLVACGSYRDDVQMICDAPSLAPSNQGKDTARPVAAYIEAHVRTREGRALAEDVANGPDGREHLLRVAREHGIAPCALAEDTRP